MNKTECNCNLRVGESPPAVGFSPVGHWPRGLTAGELFASGLNAVHRYFRMLALPATGCAESIANNRYLGGGEPSG